MRRAPLMLAGLLALAAPAAGQRGGPKPSTTRPGSTASAQTMPSTIPTEPSSAAAPTPSSGATPAQPVPPVRKPITPLGYACGFVTLAGMAVWLFRRLTRPVRRRPAYCTLCDNPLKRSAYRWFERGHVLWLCPHCNRAREAEQSRRYRRR
jgi:hypothetical protein